MGQDTLTEESFLDPTCFSFASCYLYTNMHQKNQQHHRIRGVNTLRGDPGELADDVLRIVQTYVDDARADLEAGGR